LSILSNVDLPAIFFAGRVHMITGLVWFMPRLFGNAWSELTGQPLKPARQWLAAGLVGHQVVEQPPMEMEYPRSPSIKMMSIP
jgi:hypothetical protein